VSNKLAKDIITFLILTGCRKGEVLNLKWADVDFRTGNILIKETKTDRDRHIPISKPLKLLLDNIDKISDYVFADAKTQTKIDNFNKSFKSALKKAGLPEDLHIHDLRHVFASKMAMSGTCDLYTLARLLGHSDIKMTMRYAYLIPDFLKKPVLAVWDNFEI
jgi:integrase